MTRPTEQYPSSSQLSGEQNYPSNDSPCLWDQVGSQSGAAQWIGAAGAGYRGAIDNLSGIYLPRPCRHRALEGGAESLGEGEISWDRAQAQAL